jgi:hypothetical protein
VTEPLYKLVVARFSEYFREAALLIVVFAVLDKVVVGSHIYALYLLAVFGVSMLFLGLGIWLEARFGGA